MGNDRSRSWLKLKECDWKIRSTKVNAGDFEQELLNRLRSTMAVNVLRSYCQLSLSYILYFFLHSSHTSLLKMETENFPKMLVYIYQTAWHYIPEDLTHTHHFDSLIWTVTIALIPAVSLTSLGMLIQLCDCTVCHGLVNERPLQPHRVLMVSVVNLNTWPSGVDNFVSFIPPVVIENGTDVVCDMLNIAAAATRWNIERNTRIIFK